MSRIESQQTRTAHSSTRYKIATTLLDNQESLFSMGFQNSMLKNMTESSLIQFSSEIGRTSVRYRWPFFLRLIIYGFFLLLSATSILTTKKYSTNQVDKFVLSVIEIMAISPTFFDDDSNFISNIIYLAIIFIIFILVIIFSFYLHDHYNIRHAPSAFLLNTWIIIHRTIIPIFSISVGKNFGYFIGKVFNSSEILTVIAPLILSTFNAIFYSLIVILQSSIYNATPLIRRHDTSQVWFAFSRFDLTMEFVPIIFTAIPPILKAFLSDLIVSIIFIIIVFISSGIIGFYIVTRQPYVFPKTNLFYLHFTLCLPLFSFAYLIATLRNSSLIYVFICFIISILVFYFVARFLIKKITIRCLNMFEQCRQKNEDDILLANPLLPYNFLGNQSDNEPNFEVFLETDNLTLSLLIRYGYTFDIPEVVHNSFGKWVYDSGNTDCQLVFVIAQITFLIRKDMNHLGIVQQNAASFPESPLNSKSFLYLLKCLREELLTQLNESMMTALGDAKISNRRLLSILGEFWGFVLKQNMDGMQSLLPRIAEESHETEMLFQRLFRWYPSTNLVLRESITFYHKSMGEHTMSVRFHKLFNKYRRSHNRENVNNEMSNDETSESTTMSLSYKEDEIDSKFQQKLEPWLAAEDTLCQVPNRSKRCLIFFAISTFFLTFLLSLSIFIYLVIDVNEFDDTFDPIKTITRIQFLISRIPQLLRNAQFHDLGIILENVTELFGLGKPFGEELTIVNKNSSIETAEKYAKDGISQMKSLLKHCNSLDSMRKVCLVDSFTYKASLNSSKDCSSFELMNFFFLSARDLLLKKTKINWSEVQDELEMKVLMLNFDNAFEASRQIMNMLDNSFKTLRENNAYDSMIFYILIWCSFFVYFPSILYLIFYVKRDLFFNMKLLFNIPKSEISQLHWSAKGKGQRKNLKDESRKLSNLANTESNNEMALNSKSNGNVRAEEALEGISTVPRQVGGLFTSIILVTFVYMLISSLFCTIGVWIYMDSMESTIKTSRSFEKSAASSSSVLTVYYYMQEIFANRTDNIYTSASSNNFYFTNDENENNNNENDVFLGIDNDNNNDITKNTNNIYTNNIYEKNVDTKNVNTKNVKSKNTVNYLLNTNKNNNNKLNNIKGKNKGANNKKFTKIKSDNIRNSVKEDDTYVKLNLSVARDKTNEYASYFVGLFDDLMYGDDTNDLESAIFTSSSIVDLLANFDNISDADSYNFQNSSSSSNIVPFLSILHSSYLHLSCQTLVSLLKEAARILCKEESNYNFSTPLPYHFQHMCFAHLNQLISKTSMVIYENTVETQKKSRNNLFSIFLPLVLFQISYMLTFFNYALLKTIRYVSLPKMFFQLIEPNILLKIQPIVKWISGALEGGKKQSHIDANAISKGVNSDFVLPYSKCALVLTNQDLVVEKVTDMTCTLFKHDQEEMVNENILKILTKIIISKDKTTILARIKATVDKMVSGRSKSGNRTFMMEIKTNKQQNVVNSIATNDRADTLFLELYLRSHSKNDEDSDMISLYKPAATSFSLVFYDKTAEHFQEELVQYEKARGEQLLSSFLPPAIFKRINDGDTEIFFEVPAATVMFSSIANWNNMIESMTAQEVLKTLNRLYMAYDEELKTFPSITKLKTIGHVYMLACGLFTDSSVNHADTTVRFALKLFEVVCQINDEMSWNLTITCGINTGGPINCGIIGKTRPTFDIIGDPVNFASRLNSNGIENYIQLSETTYDLIKYLSYPIRERGEISFKGKGMKKAFLISPQSHLSQSGLLRSHTAENQLAENSSNGIGGFKSSNRLSFIAEETSSEMLGDKK